MSDVNPNSADTGASSNPGAGDNAGGSEGTYTTNTFDPITVTSGGSEAALTNLASPISPETPAFAVPPTSTTTPAATIPTAITTAATTTPTAAVPATTSTTTPAAGGAGAGTPQPPQQPPAQLPPTQNPDVARLIDQGNSLVGQGDIRGAVDVYQQALLLAQQVGDLTSQPIIEGNLGVAYNKINDPTNAIKNLLLAKDKISDPQRRAAILGNLGNAYLKQNDVPTALLYYQQALDLARANRDKVVEGQTLSNIGNAYYQEDKVEEAINTLKQAQTIQSNNGDEQGKAITDNLLNQAKITQATQQQSQTIQNLQTELTGQRYKLAQIFVSTFALGLLFLGLILAAGIISEAIKAAQGIAPSANSFFNFSNMIQLLTTFAGIVGTPLGFVMGFYFKDQEVKAAQVAQQMGQAGVSGSGTSSSGSASTSGTSGSK